MFNALPFRSLIVLALGSLLGCLSGGAYAQEHFAPVVREVRPMLQIEGTQPPAPIERRAPDGSGSSEDGRGNGVRGNAVHGNGLGGEHLPQWMSRHANMTLEQQQEALDREPGFRQLPEQTRKRMHERLAQLHAMPPMQRERMLAHTEAMERLTLPQRAEVRGALEQLGSLPPDQRRQVAQSFRELRLVPPEHRMAVLLYSGRYSWLNEPQRITLLHLIQVAPMLPPQ